jgi:hypothetical protein
MMLTKQSDAPYQATRPSEEASEDARKKGFKTITSTDI